MSKMKFNGSEKQNKWANDILEKANLSAQQIENLLRWAGPTLHNQGIMDAQIIIDNRDKLAAYADSLRDFYKLSREEKHAVAEEAAGVLGNIARKNMDI